MCTPRTGTEFMNWVRDRYTWVLGDQAVADLQLFKKKTSDGDPTEWLYMIINPVVNGEYLIDNSSTCTTIKINNGARYPKLTVGLELAKKMQWIMMGVHNGRPRYVLGPHLRKDFPTGVVPTAVDVQQSIKNGVWRFLQARRGRIAFELLHQLGVRESRRELRTSLRIDASTVTRVFECRAKYSHGKSSDGFTARSPLRLVRTLLRTSSRPISTVAHRRDQHYRDASGRE